MVEVKTLPIRIYTTRWCGFCFAAKRLFTRLGVDFDEIRVDRQPELRREVSQSAGNWPTVPMVFIGDRFVGGYSEIVALNSSGDLERLMTQQESPAGD